LIVLGLLCFVGLFGLAVAIMWRKMNGDNFDTDEEQDEEQVGQAVHVPMAPQGSRLVQQGAGYFLLEEPPSAAPAAAGQQGKPAMHEHAQSLPPVLERPTSRDSEGPVVSEKLHAAGRELERESSPARTLSQDEKEARKKAEEAAEKKAAEKEEARKKVAEKEEARKKAEEAVKKANKEKEDVGSKTQEAPVTMTPPLLGHGGGGVATPLLGGTSLTACVGPASSTASRHATVGALLTPPPPLVGRGACGTAAPVLGARSLAWGVGAASSTVGAPTSAAAARFVEAGVRPLDPSRIKTREAPL